MKKLKSYDSNNMLLIILLTLTLVCIGINFLPIGSSQAQKMSDTPNELVKQQEQMFWKKSSTSIPADDGNKIVGIRRINLSYKDVDEKGNTFSNEKLIYEVEVFSKVIVPVTNSNQHLLIGDLEIQYAYVTGDRHTIYIHLSPEEFERIKDGAIINLSIFPGKINAEQLKDSYKNGEPKEIVGAKFGRIDKKAADQLSIFNEDVESLNKRLFGVKKD